METTGYLLTWRRLRPSWRVDQKSHYLCPPADVSIFVMSVNHEKNGNSLDCQQYFLYHQLLSLFLLFISSSLYSLSMSLSTSLLPFFHPFHFCSLFHERHCCDPACATDQDVRPYGYPEQPFSCSWGLFQSVYSFWKLVSEFWQHSFENLMGCEHSEVNWDDCPCLLPGNVLPILGVLLWKRALCHKASISVEWGHLEETNRKCQE